MRCPDPGFVVFMAFTLILTSVTILSVVSPPSIITNVHNLGDEVVTTDEYNAIFNDSFTGHVVAVRDGMYMVRCENGIEREFAFKWLDKYTQEEVI